MKSKIERVEICGVNLLQLRVEKEDALTAWFTDEFFEGVVKHPEIIELYFKREGCGREYD